ncbi:MAG: LysM peptidoglycan-binding domain-containing protein [Actinomycetota bacterium]|nr:LysM peptidoglycan-binding domain-containing protein [Actinomycetota bacterium]
MSQSVREPWETEEVGRRPLEWDRTDPPVKVLWGRVAALATTLVVAYLIGWATGPRGVPAEELQGAETELAAAQGRIDELETRLEETTSPESSRPVLRPDAQDADEADRPQAQNPSDGNDAGRDAAEGPATTQAPEAGPASGRTYVVRDGDSLNTIAIDFYGDASLVNLIAKANNITARGQIQAGQRLELPPKP